MSNEILRLKEVLDRIDPPIPTPIDNKDDLLRAMSYVIGDDGESFIISNIDFMVYWTKMLVPSEDPYDTKCPTVAGEVTKAVKRVIDYYTQYDLRICNDSYDLFQLQSSINVLTNVGKKYRDLDIIIDEAVVKPQSSYYDDVKYEVRVIDNLIDVLKILLVKHTDYACSSYK